MHREPAKRCAGIRVMAVSLQCANLHPSDALQASPAKWSSQERLVRQHARPFVVLGVWAAGLFIAWVLLARRREAQAVAH
jgi:hypothetical protein